MAGRVQYYKSNIVIAAAEMLSLDGDVVSDDTEQNLEVKWL